MRTDRLIYTNSAGQSIEFSVDSVYHTNVRTDTKGLVSVKNSIYKQEVVGVDGSIKTGNHIESRPIEIKGFIDHENYGDNGQLARDLSGVFNPTYSGVLRLESDQVYEIDVDVEEGPDDPDRPGARYPDYKIGLIALNPNWRALYDSTVSIADSGTSVYYGGSKECGMSIEIIANADNVDAESITISNSAGVKTVTFRTGGGIDLMDGDVVLLSTTPSRVNITLNDETALERIDFNNSVFPFVLMPGKNEISWAAYGDEADFSVSCSFTPLYGAV
jgi:hypothetical protein